MYEDRMGKTICAECAYMHTSLDGECLCCNPRIDYVTGKELYIAEDCYVKNKNGRCRDNKPKRKEG